MMDVELIEHRIGILDQFNQQLYIYTSCVAHLAQASGEDHYLVDFAHLLKKVVHTRSLQDVEVMPVILNLDGNNKIGLLNRLALV